MVDVNWNHAAVEDLLNSLDGPVGKLMQEKAVEMAAVAKAAAPLQKRSSWSWGRDSSSYMPRSVGYLKSSVKPHVGYTKSGTIYGGVNAAYGPTLFLQKPADQLHRDYPFLTQALYSVTV